MFRRRFGQISLSAGCHMVSFLEVVHGRLMLKSNSIVQRDPEVIAAEADRDLVMVRVATGHYYGVSDVARPTRVSDLVNDLVADYQIDSISCEQQTLSFLEALLDEGLLQVKDAAAG
jgi:hypothetical protein